MRKGKTRGRYHEDPKAHVGRKKGAGAGDGKRGVTRSTRKVGRR